MPNQNNKDKNKEQNKIYDRSTVVLPYGEGLTVICGKDLPPRGFPEFLDHNTSQEGGARIERFPEYFMHPDYQLSFARSYAIRVNRGEQLVLMTYSDYLIKELNTLIMLHSLPKERREQLYKEYKEYSDDLLLDPEKVKCYDLIGRSGEEVRDCKINKFGMCVPSFDLVIDKMNELQDEIVYGE